MAGHARVRVQVRVLNKEPKGREVEQGDSFTFNSGFADKQFRIKINTIQLKETEEENKKTNEQVRPSALPRPARARQRDGRARCRHACVAVNALCAWPWTLCRSVMLLRLKAAAIWI